MILELHHKIIDPDLGPTKDIHPYDPQNGTAEAPVQNEWLGKCFVDITEAVRVFPVEAGIFGMDFPGVAIEMKNGGVNIYFNEFTPVMDCWVESKTAERLATSFRPYAVPIDCTIPKEVLSEERIFDPFANRKTQVT